MLYHNYLESLLGSRVKVKILRTLCRHRGKESTVRELADFLDVSHIGVLKALEDLALATDHGTVCSLAKKYVETATSTDIEQ